MAKKKNAPILKSIVNSLQDFSQSLIPMFGTPGGNINELSSTDTLYFNLRWYLISNFRQLLAELYVEHGIVQTLVDQPIEDAFRAGFEIKTAQLNDDEISQLQIYLERHGVISAVKMALKWARLFGGGAVLLINNEDPRLPFDIDSVDIDTPLEFRAVDMWELYADQMNIQGDITVGGALGADNAKFYNYYGKMVDHTRVYKVVGKEAPSFIRPRLRGWGMSEIEKVVRSLNQYMRNQDVVFALLNEAKVDVYRLQDFNEALMTDDGSASTQKRLHFVNLIKSYLNGIVMDKNDEYEQKQITFAGLAEVLVQIRQGIAADLKMPMTKLFGISSAGFNSGEDDIENYNAMLEGERAKSKFIVLDMIEISCRKLFGLAPDDLNIEFNPLRVLGAEEEEKVKDYQFNRVMSSYNSGLIQSEETKRAINYDSLLGIEIDEKKPAVAPMGSENLVGTTGNVDKPE